MSTFISLVSIVVILLTHGIQLGFGLDNGLALTPPMGWMTWQRFRCITDCDIFPDDCISERLIKRTADVMARGGYRDAGYEYIVIDDCWSEMERDPVTGELIPDRKRFPNGMKYIGDYIHSLGLKFGIYQDYGTHTCEGYPGIIGYEEIDAQSFADWGVDYVKLDGCYADIIDMDEGYPHFGALLNQTGRPMVYSCSWPFFQGVNGIMPNFELIAQHCNLWRIWYDIQDSWSSMNEIVKYFAENQDRIVPNAAPGNWNDPDMLLIGNFGLSLEQSQAQMALWAILAAPLLMSNDLDHIRPEYAEILLNIDIIAVNQDALGIQGRRVLTKNGIELWTRPLQATKAGHINLALAIVSLRTDGQPYRLSIDLSDISIDQRNSAGFSMADLYNMEEAIEVWVPQVSFDVIVNPSGCRFFKLTSL